MGLHVGKKLRVHIIQLDLADLASVKQFAQKVQALLGGKTLDVLVSCNSVPRMMLVISGIDAAVTTQSPGLHHIYCCKSRLAAPSSHK